MQWVKVVLNVQTLSYVIASLGVTYFIHSSLIQIRHCSTTSQFNFWLATAFSIFSKILGAKQLKRAFVTTSLLQI